MDELQIVRAHTLAVQELNQTLVDLLTRLESSDRPASQGGDLAAAMAPLVEAMKTAAAATPLTEQAITLNAEFKSPPGSSWSVKAKRTLDGFDMTVTKTI